jgi:hypothetical protein
LRWSSVGVKQFDGWVAHSAVECVQRRDARNDSYRLGVLAGVDTFVEEGLNRLLGQTRRIDSDSTGGLDQWWGEEFMWRMTPVHH